MMQPGMELPVVFAALMGVSILAYVVLDGFDLGVGMLMPAADPQEQNLMVNSIGPFWDANETWLVLGVGILLVAFPSAHGVVLQALYLPVVAMLVGLMLRGVAFEFRMKAEGWHRELWNWLFWAGSFLASFAQGVMLGRYVTGFAPGIGYWLFAAMTGAALCGGYVLLGATWLVLKTEGTLQQKALAWARWGLGWVALGVALVSIGTPLVSETVRAKWFTFPDTLWLMLLPASCLAAGLRLWFVTGKLMKENPQAERPPEWAPSGQDGDGAPFVDAVLIFVLAFLGLAYSIFPWVVIDRIGIWDASRPEALKAVLWGAVLVLPFIVGYNVLSYRVFRGKAREKLYD